MDNNWRESLWRQYGAAIDTLDDAIVLCPEQLWMTVVWKDPEDARFGEFWFVAYHTVRWLDVFLIGSQEGWAPPPPFLKGMLPEQPYTKEQVRAYLSQCRSRCQSIIEGLTEERARQRCVFEWMEPSFLELQLYCMRHLQEHAAQLTLVLGNHDVTGFDWIVAARDAT